MDINIFQLSNQKIQVCLYTYLCGCMHAHMGTITNYYEVFTRAIRKKWLGTAILKCISLKELKIKIKSTTNSLM